MQKFLFLLAFISLLGCKDTSHEIAISNDWNHPYQAIAQSGDTLFAATPD